MRIQADDGNGGTDTATVTIDIGNVTAENIFLGVEGSDPTSTFKSDAITAGDFIMLIRMVDVDDWTTDPDVTVMMYVGHDPAAVPRVEAGRTYQVNYTFKYKFT